MKGMKTPEEKLKIACEMIKEQKITIERLSKKCSNQRRQLKNYDRLEREGRKAILAEETRIKLEARERAREARRMKRVKVEA